MRVRINFLGALLAVLGIVLGLLYARYTIQQHIAFQLQHRNWVDYTGLDSYYFIYGFIGYVVGFSVHFVIRHYFLSHHHA